MRDVEYGVVWNVVSWYEECCIMQVWQRCDVKCGGVELMKNVAYALCCQMWKKIQCVVMSVMVV